MIVAMNLERERLNIDQKLYIDIEFKYSLKIQLVLCVQLAIIAVSTLHFKSLLFSNWNFKRKKNIQKSTFK